jgi:hypothetical protein
VKSRLFWGICLLGIIAAGILSRSVHTGWLVVDKYLGDVLYAAMVYVILRLLNIRGTALWTAVIMVALELFQLTGVALRMLGREHWIVRICARLLGTEFSWLDLVSYGVGILGIKAVDSPDYTGLGGSQ